MMIVLRVNNIRYLKCVVEYDFSNENEHLVPQLASKMIKLEVARINYDNNGLMILKDVTEHCHRTLKSIEFNHRNSSTSSVNLTLCPNVTKLGISINDNISNRNINNIISSFPNVIHLNVLNYGPGYDISFNGLARLIDAKTRRSKLQSIRLRSNSLHGRAIESCDSLLLSLLSSCPHLSYFIHRRFLANPS
jgi:hypothetical protein